MAQSARRAGVVMRVVCGGQSPEAQATAGTWAWTPGRIAPRAAAQDRHAEHQAQQRVVAEREAREHGAHSQRPGLHAGLGWKFIVTSQRRPRWAGA